jgi:hypothetical protein
MQLTLRSNPLLFREMNGWPKEKNMSYWDEQEDKTVDKVACYESAGVGLRLVPVSRRNPFSHYRGFSIVNSFNAWSRDYVETIWR